MASTTLKIGYRPLRVGFCVNPNELQDVREAIRLSTILWGGIYNPIIPISKTKDSYTEQLVKVFQVDVLYPLCITPEIEKFIQSHQHLQWPRYNSGFFHQDDKGLRPVLLDVSNIINYYWEKEFKDNTKSNCVIPEWNVNDELAPVFAANFGEYPTDPKIQFDYKKGFTVGLRAKTVKIDKEKNLSADICKRITPIQLSDTMLELGGDGWGWTYHGIYLGEMGNPEDLINFWNLRASAMDLYFVPLNKLERVRLLAKKHIEGVAKRMVSQKFRTGAAIWYRDEVGDEVVRKHGDALFKNGVQRTHCRISEHSWNGLNIKPLKSHFETKTVLTNLERPYDKLSMSFSLPEKVFEQNRYNTWQKLAITCDPFIESGYEGHTLTLPYLPELNEWYGREIVFDPSEFRVGKGEFSKIVGIYEETATIQPINNTDLIKKLFDYVGIQAKESQPGLVAQRLIEQMGRLDACRVFQITGVRKLLSLTPLDNFVTRGNATGTIWDFDKVTNSASFERHKQLHIQQKDRPELTTEEVFDFLIDKNVFRVGIEPLCPNCGLKFWLGIKETKDEIPCEYCGYVFKIGLQLKDRGDWKFRKSGLFGKDNKQEGAIPVILTLMQLMRRSDRRGNFVYSTALKLDSKVGIDCETDFVVVNATHEGASVVIGECKSNNFEINDKDIENLKKVKDKLERFEGIKSYLLFSKTSSFTNSEITRFKKLMKEGVTPILFTDKDLEPYDAYMDYSLKKVKLPDPYTHDFEGVARNSAFLYLRDKSKSKS